MDPGKGAYQYRPDVHKTRFHGGMLTRGSFTVILIPDNDGSDTGFLIIPGSGRHFAVFTGELVFHQVGLPVEIVHRPNEQVV